MPSCPVSEKTGMKARMMIAIEKKTGRPTSLVESLTVSHMFLRSLGSTFRFSKKRKAFSVTTIPASTNTPMAIAIPPRHRHRRMIDKSSLAFSPLAFQARRAFDEQFRKLPRLRPVSIVPARGRKFFPMLEVPPRRAGPPLRPIPAVKRA